MIDSATEQAWVHDARAGSADAYGKLVRLHGGTLRAFLRRLTGNEAEADDVAQDAFVFAWEKLHRFDPARPFRPWLFAIAWRKCRERQRGWRRLLARETRHFQEQYATGDADPGLRLDLAAATAKLPPEQRGAILLCLALDFTHLEAAQALALPLGTVKSHIAWGREKLAAFLGDET